MSKKKENYKHHLHTYFIFCLIWLIAKQYMKASVRLYIWIESILVAIHESYILRFFLLGALFSSHSFCMSHITSSSTNQSLSKFWLDVTHFASSDGNVNIAFFLHPFESKKLVHFITILRETQMLNYKSVPKR